MRTQSLAASVALSFFLTAAAAQEPASSSLPAVQPSGRPTVGLALEGGGALGLAHIGVLQWLEENHIPIDRLSGASMGSLIGALYATGHSPANMRSLAESGAFAQVFSLQSPYADASFRRRQDRREIPQALTVGLNHRVALGSGLLIDHGVNEFLVLNMPGYNGRQLDFDRLPIPFRCVATDLNTLESVTFSAGPLTQAVRASISIPGVFPPALGSNGHYLVDGGILDNLPTGVLKRELHADTVIAVRLEDGPLKDSDTLSIVGVLNRAFSAGIIHNVNESERLADVVVHVPVGNFSTTDYARASELIDSGYKAAGQSSTALLRYALDESGWKTYLANRQSRQFPTPGPLLAVRVEGSDPGAVREVRRDLKPLEGKPITPEATAEALKSVQANGGISAAWETFAHEPASGQGVASTSGQASPDTGLLVRLSRDRIGPPYLLLGPELAASTSNVTRGEMALRLVDQNLGGYGSEFRANARVGYMTELSAEYYRLLTPAGYFIEPRARILRQPVYIWANQKRIAERFQQNLDLSLEAGRTFSNQVQLSAEWRAEDTHWSLRTGAGGGPFLSGTAQTGLLRLSIDRATAGAISPRGFRLAASAGALFHAAASDNAPLVNLSFGRTWLWRDRNIFGLGGEINSYLRARVAEPYRFTLGGPMRLSASSIDEYRGTDTWLARAGYLHRIAALPTGLGQGLYAVFGYEAGERWSPDARALLRQDAITGLVANTPLGLVTFGVSVGDAGRRKVFLTLGRWF